MADFPASKFAAFLSKFDENEQGGILGFLKDLWTRWGGESQATKTLLQYVKDIPERFVLTMGQSRAKDPEAYKTTLMGVLDADGGEMDPSDMDLDAIEKDPVEEPEVPPKKTKGKKPTKAPARPRPSVEELPPLKLDPPSHAPNVVGAAKTEATVEELLSSFMGGPLPKSKKEFGPTVGRLVKEGKVSKEDARLLAILRSKVGPDALAKAGSVEQLLRNVKSGRVDTPGFFSKLLTNLTGLGGKTKGYSPSPAYTAEKALAGAGVEGFVGRGAAVSRGLREAGRFAKRPGVLIPGIIAGLMGMDIARRRKEVSEINSMPVIPAEELERRMRLEEAAGQRKVELQRSPEDYAEVVRILTGGPDTKLTRNTVQIGNVVQGRSPSEVNALMDKLMLGLARQRGDDRDSSALLLNQLLAQRE